MTTAIFAKAAGCHANTVEMFALKTLDLPFPKPDNLENLMLHYALGEAYEKMQDSENAAKHYQYCADNGGETALKTASIAALQRLLLTQSV